MSFLIHGLVLFLLLLVSAFFSSSETAIFSLSRIDRNRLERNAPRWYRWVRFHLDKPRRAISTLLIGNLIVNTLASAIVTLMALQLWGRQHVSLSLGVFTIVLILFSEIIPKIIAVHRNEQVAKWHSIPLAVFSVLIFPLWKLTRWASNLILSRILKDRTEVSDVISEEELKALVKVGEEEGILDRDERRMIHKIFELGNRKVQDIMTPRIEVQGLDVEEPLERHLELIRQFHHTQFPVFKGSLDNVLGVVSVQDYVLDGEGRLEAILKQPLFVPETKRIDDLLAEFRNKKQNFAVCVDEYGGTAGLVTLEDILEEIFGEFYDEYAKVENPIRPYSFREYLVDAKIPLVELNEKLGLQLESREASTLAGLILETLGEIPEKGRILKMKHCQIRIQEVVRKRRIHTVIMKVLT